MGAVVSSDSCVTFHYSAYLEMSDEPFDSTRMRNRPHRSLRQLVPLSLATLGSSPRWLLSGVLLQEHWMPSSQALSGIALCHLMWPLARVAALQEHWLPSRLCNVMVLGLAKALMTMRKGERARVLV
ncbi:hypothetical protein HPB47_015677 [Ixodes persulcatus]|uniref:Uncharacterized protein n=1 Tax=Ixodes persulcatus TaxID=34615 RepID=A0AC60QWG4_IXOPE|nr:hypothetical protein HPB47_015677 [Ixodes persulcatus]